MALISKKECYWILTFTVISVIVSLTMIIKAPIVEGEVLSFPSPIVVTPLDSPNGCYPQYFWSKVE